MEKIMMEMDRVTGQLGYVGTVENPIEIEVVEIEIDGGFRIEGTTVEGQKVVAELSTEAFFDGKFFVAGKMLEVSVPAEETKLITPEYFSATHLMEYQAQLEYSTSPTIHHFMVNSICFDYDSNPLWVELAGLLEATMERKNGWWIDKDII